MNSAALYRLMSWLSPSYPVGAFSYSHGLEFLVESGAVKDAATLAEWVEDVLLLGSGRNDAILFAHAHGAAVHGNFAALIEVADYANAFAASAERHLETSAQGRAFCEITIKTWQSPALNELTRFYPRAIAYPVAVGAAAADHRIALADGLHAYMHGFVANLVSAGVRLIPLGHTDGQRVMLQLETAAGEAVRHGIEGSLSLLSSVTVLADLAAIQHETQYTRLFRS